MATLSLSHVAMHVLENAELHHTDLFEIVHAGAAVLRRGQPFVLTLNFLDRGYDDVTDLVRLAFTTGSSPTPLKTSWGVATVMSSATTDVSKNLWQVRELMRQDRELKLEVRCPATVPVGRWRLRVDTRPRDDRSAPTLSYDHPEDIYLLFNPWCKEDGVFMSDRRLLKEYVLADVGKIWVGPYGSSRGREWVFGQFDDSVLPAIMLMLERCGLQSAYWGDPVKLSRALSKIVNSNDDQGVLVGRWDGNYEDGTAPAEWTGSVPILEKFLATENEVSYGQCWVFAGVVTTVCRALGLPSRVVTNFVSAHDANASLTVDRYFSADGEEMKYDPNNTTGEDSVWNYHVWNDVWMSRPDLPSGYGGWQAIDSTPQEKSSGFFQCGPASLEAIRRGAVGLNFDVPFLLASVNADLVSWKEDDKCDLGYSKMQCNKYHIGRMVYTKQPFVFDPNGSKDREDITQQYKAKEGSKAERLTLLNGVRNTDLAKQFYEVADLASSDIAFDLIELDTIQLGEDFSVTVTIENKCTGERRVQASLSAASVYYTGIRAHLVKTATGDFKVKPKSKETLRLVVRPEEYMGKLVEYCNMKIYAIASVADTGAVWADEDDFQVIKPNIHIQVPESVQVGAACNVVFSFKNPLKKVLNGCRFNYSGPGLSKNTVIPYRDVRAQEEVRVEHRFVPQRAGELKLVATFSSRELVDVSGSAQIQVLEQ